MSEPRTETVDLNGHACRVWKKGNGAKIGFLAGFGGLPRWMPFLDRLAEQREVIVPSLPGFPGATGHTLLDSHLDWLVAVRELLRKSGLEGADLAGSSAGGSFVLEMAALWPASVKKVAVIAPFGLFDLKDPATDVWAQKADAVAGLLCADAQKYIDMKAMPPGANSVEWPIEQVRAAEAAARIFWPFGNTRLEKRLPMVQAPLLILRGDQDRIIPRSYPERIKAAVKGKAELREIKDAGHLAEIDQPDAVAKAILDWTA